MPRSRSVRARAFCTGLSETSPSRRAVATANRSVYDTSGRRKVGSSVSRKPRSALSASSSSSNARSSARSTS